MTGSRFEECEPGQYKMVRYLVIIIPNSCKQIKADKREDIVVIASGKIEAHDCVIPRAIDL
jgi:hypothetical protein